MTMELSERCEIHASKMDDEGWYVTANVLAQAAQELRQLKAKVEELGKLVEWHTATLHW